MRFFDRHKDVRRKILPVKLAVVAFLLVMTSVTAWRWLSVEEDPALTAMKLTPEEAAELPEPEESLPEDSKSETAVAAAYFAAYRMDREDSRAEELSLLDEMLADETLSPEAREQAEARKLAISAAASDEAEAESLLTAYGFGETVVILGESRATVIVDVEMDSKKATQIAETVDSVSGCGFENVVVVNR